MDDFHQLEGSIRSFDTDLSEQAKAISDEKHIIEDTADNLSSLEHRISLMMKKVGAGMPTCEEDSFVEEINAELDESLFRIPQKTESDKQFDLNKIDLIVSCLAGGLAVLVDFLVVKVPKDISIRIDGKNYNHEGSPLTELFRKIGASEDGKESKWVQKLESWFHVHYDKSICEGIPKMYPKNHRVFSLAHDPGIMGLIWGIHDLATGNFSYIDKAGMLHIDKVVPADAKKLFYAPIKWLGHIISDVFTKQGIPIPGTSMLRTLQVGSFGDKDRTLGELVEYMYVNGYDMRHLATMAMCNIVINLIVTIYSKLTAT